jgi:outer membrane immunogenic protein
MHKLLARSVGLLAMMAGSAVAADMKAPVYKAPPAPMVEDPWTGFYGGINAGGSIARGRATDLDTTNVPTFLPVIGGDTFRHAPIGGVFGAQLGWNYHAAPSWVLGIEADGQWTNQNDTACVSGCLPALPPSFLLAVIDEQSLKWFATARGRVGWLAPSGALWYATGGAAWARVEDTVTLTGSPGYFPGGATSAAATFDHTKLGWTIGAGVETPVAPHWSIKAEYLYVDLGRFNDSFTVALGPGVGAGGTQTTATSYSVHDNIIRVGLNYHFGETASAMASAAPIYKAPPAPPAAWNGFYAGLNGGASIARNRTIDNSITDDPFFPVFGADNFSHAPVGGVFGGQVGVNWQPARSWVLGLEGDMQWASASDTACISQCLPAATPGILEGLTDQQSLKWFGTARARLGWETPQGSLWYATGGAAWGRVEQTLTAFATPGFFATGTSMAASFAHNRIGWTVGGGVETPLWRDWSVKAEYLYVDLGTTTNSMTAALAPNNPSGDTTITTTSTSAIHDHIVRVGFNYHLH